jgi:N,N-dimethylformamidase
MPKAEIYGYTDRLTAKGGETLQFMVSAVGTDHARAQLVRLIHGDEHPDGPGFIEKPVDAEINRMWPVRRQYVQKGNFLRVPDAVHTAMPAGGFAFYAFVFPTLPRSGRQSIMGRWSIGERRGQGFGIDENGRLALWLGDGKCIESLTTDKSLVPRIWYFVAAGFDPSTGAAFVHQHAVINRYNSLLSKIAPFEYDSHVDTTLGVRPRDLSDIPFLIAGANDRDEARGPFVAQCYSGKLDRCGIVAGTLDREQLDAMSQGGEPPTGRTVACWDTTQGYTDRGIGDTVFDTGPNRLQAVGVNCPVRALTGWNWNGREDCFRLAPEQFGGIEFHSDALTDCDWRPTFSFTLPDEFRSGVYAVKLTAGEGDARAEEYLPFFVRARTPRAAICFLVPTSSYMAYANAQIAFDTTGSLETITGVTTILQQIDIDVARNGAEFGASTYDLHNDGSGICYASYHRPLFSMRPKYRMPAHGCAWQFPADLSIVGWLEHVGYDYEILTDEDVERDGVAALRPYRAVINGTHCEYSSERLLDAVEDYLADGGRLLYLAGNGYYWVVAFREQQPWIMEVRRLDAGSRAWQAQAGEGYLATTGERGGLWRHRNRAPQKLVGTGFTSQGMDASVAYRRLPDSYSEAASWIFEGVAGEVFGNFGLARGGAAGMEVDRYDLSLGTPPHALLLASSEPFSENFQLVQEDILFTVPGLGGSQNPQVRCDMVYFGTAKGGAVFSASSIAWSSALPWNKFDNEVSRIMKNVLDAFAREGPLPGT